MEKASAATTVPDFEILFAADQEPERVPFTVQGRECWIELKPMDSEDSNRFQTKGFKFKMSQQGATVQRSVEDIDVAERERFLVSRTVIDWQFWRQARKRDGTLGEWQMERGPDNERARSRFIEDNFRCTASFWRWLVGECERVNGLTEADQGN